MRGTPIVRVRKGLGVKAVNGLTEMHPTLRELVEISAKRKWISYEEINTVLPDEMVDPEKLDELLVSIEDLGIRFLNEEIVPWLKERYSDVQPRLVRLVRTKGIGRNRPFRRHEQWIDIKIVQAARMFGGKCGDRFDGIEDCLDIGRRAATITP